MLDSYIYGRKNGTSPEADVPIFLIEKSFSKLGGAANVALNLKQMGCQPIIMGICGSDSNAQKLRDCLVENLLDDQFIFSLDKRCTTRKTRVIEEDKHQLRIDEEIITEIATDTADYLLKKLAQGIENSPPDLVIYQDYNKGLLTKYFIASSLQLFSGQKIPVAIDPKFNHIECFSDCFLFKPNLKEFYSAINQQQLSKEMLRSAASAFRAKIKAKHLLITMANDGMLLVSEQATERLAAKQVNVLDVSGAGDTVIAVAAVLLLITANFEWSAKIASLCAASVIQDSGVVAISKSDFNAILTHN